MDRYILQELSNNGYIYYGIMDTENDCKIVFKSYNYVEVIERLRGLKK